jgi:hypothetical protein
VEEYLDHNELGLAFDLIVYELDRLEVRLPADTLERLRSAAERMGGESALDLTPVRPGSDWRLATALDSARGHSRTLARPGIL